MLAKDDYPYKEFRLGPPLPPKIAAPEARRREGSPATDPTTTTDDARTTRAPTPTGRSTSPCARPCGSWTTRSTSGATASTGRADHAPLTAAAKG